MPCYTDCEDTRTPWKSLTDENITKGLDLLWDQMMTLHKRISTAEFRLSGVETRLDDLEDDFYGEDAQESSEGAGTGPKRFDFIMEDSPCADESENVYEVPNPGLSFGELDGINNLGDIFEKVMGILEEMNECQR